MSVDTTDADEDEDRSLQELTASILETGTSTEAGERLVRGLHEAAKEGKL